MANLSKVYGFCRIKKLKTIKQLTLNLLKLTKPKTSLNLSGHAELHLIEKKKMKESILYEKLL